MADSFHAFGYAQFGFLATEVLVEVHGVVGLDSYHKGKGIGSLQFQVVFVCNNGSSFVADMGLGNAFQTIGKRTFYLNGLRGNLHMVVRTLGSEQDFTIQFTGLLGLVMEHQHLVWIATEGFATEGGSVSLGR